MPLQLLRDFFRYQASGGIVLVLSAIAALILANLGLTRELYQAFLEIPVEVRVGAIYLDKNLLLIVNDGLMAVFFLLVGLEIKREILAGELKQIGQVAVPGVAALGGIALPALIYVAINRGDAEALGGWAIPAATDIAFALGVLALFGSRVPIGLKVFLTTVAIIDDLAAILIVALFYTGKLSTTALLFAGVCVLLLFILNRAGVTDYGAYALVGIALWVAVLKSGVHATLAGVLIAFFVPLQLDKSSHDCPARRLEHALHPWAAFFVLPLFAFANAGVSFAGVTAEQAFGGVSLGILFGLTIGKVVGVWGFGKLAVVLGLGRLPEGANTWSFLGVACLCGIGFTMSLFIGSLAFDEQGLHYEVATRIGVFGGSIVSALLGAALLSRSLPAPGDAGPS
jgi:NhaA family Na+:H+ antiporter